MPEARGARLLLAVVVLLGGVLRVVSWSPGFHSDELANVMPGGFLAVLTDPEIGVNPPLLRVLVNPWLEDLDAARMGRALALLAGTALIPAAFLLARRAAAGSEAAGLLAATLLAVHPVAVGTSVEFRAYAPAALVATWHLHALLGWLASPHDRAGRRAAAQVVVSALLLPWLHYAWAPVLLGLGLGGALLVRPLRRLPLLYLPAEVAAAPLALAILSQPVRRVDPVGALPTLERVVSLGIPASGLIVGRGGDLVRSLGGAGPTGLGWQALVVLGLLASCGVAWRWLPTASRVLWLAAVSFIAAVMVMGTAQLVRPPILLFLLVPLVPLLTALPAALPWPVARVAAWGGLAVLLLPRLPDALATEVAARHRQGAMPALLAWWQEHPEAGTLAVWPRPAAGWLWFHAAGQHPGRFTGEPGCDTADGCFAAAGRRWVGVDHPPSAGWSVAFAPRPPEPFESSCAREATAPGLWLYRCGGPSAP